MKRGIWKFLFKILGILFFVPSILMAAELRQVHISWNYSASVDTLAGFRLYNDGVKVCETDIPSSREMDCEVLLEVGTTSFTLTAYDDSLNESTHSASTIVTIDASNNAPTISGTSATIIAEGSAYSFTPTANDIDTGDTLVFSITNKPSWSVFNTANGALIGTPGNSDVGNSSNIIITVTDSSGASASLPAFNLTVAAVVEGMIEAESGVLVSPMRIVSSAEASGGAYIQTTTNSSGTATYAVNIDTSGTYKIIARVYALDGSQNSFFIQIDDQEEDIWDINPEGDSNKYGVWLEDEVTKRGTGTFDNPQYDPFTIELTSGIHTVTFRGRETNTRFDYFNFTGVNIVLAGDVNDSGTVDLEDLYLVQEILAGRTPSQTIHAGADVNGDGQIGMAEVQYILQKISGSR